MKSKFSLKNHENGQVIPILVVGVLVAVMMTALLIDGGMLMAHRRTAQAAADAGALAGAERLCENNPVSLEVRKQQAHDKAIEYVEKNFAQFIPLLDEENVSGFKQFPSDDSILVIAEVESSSFFARIFEQTGLTARAVAQASCTPPSTAKSTLPVAFPCLNPTYDPITGVATKCEMSFYDEDLSFEENIAAGNMTMVMTSNATKENCYDEITNPDGVNCDANGDGIPDVISMSSTGWLSLDGGPQFKDGWIDGSIEAPMIAPRTWLGTISGTSTDIYKFLKGFIDVEFVVPIYDKESEGNPKSTGAWENGDIDTYIRDGKGLNHYRIIGFAQFKLTCIHETGTDQTKDGSVCPFRDWLIKSPLHNYSKQPNLKSIEGYFTKGTLSIGGGSGPELGLYVVRLIPITE